MTHILGMEKLLEKKMKLFVKKIILIPVLNEKNNILALVYFYKYANISLLI